MTPYRMMMLVAAMMAGDVANAEPQPQPEIVATFGSWQVLRAPTGCSAKFASSALRFEIADSVDGKYSLRFPGANLGTAGTLRVLDGAKESFSMEYTPANVKGPDLLEITGFKFNMIGFSDTVELKDRSGKSIVRGGYQDGARAVNTVRGCKLDIVEKAFRTPT